MTYFLWACALGGLSAASLPLGSWVGLTIRLTPLQISLLAAFGAGALLAALSVELVAPIAFELVEGAGEPAPLFVLVFGCVIGGVTYVALDHQLNRKGGFLRKKSTLLRYFQRQTLEAHGEVLEKLSAIPPFVDFPPEAVETLLDVLVPVEFDIGDVIIRQGDPSNSAYLIQEGRIDALVDDRKIQVIDPEDGSICLVQTIMGVNSPATAIALTPVQALEVTREDFDRLRKLFPGFDRACRGLSPRRTRTLAGRMVEGDGEQQDWYETARDAVIVEVDLPPPSEIRRVKEAHRGAPLAIWLGILLDGIPESIVIGAGMLGMLSATLAAHGDAAFMDVVPFTLVAGLFLSNFPEALSSSASMLDQGWRPRRIFLMWFAVMVVTAVGAGLGYLAAGELHHAWLVLCQGMAAGAMLTMIAAAMIPEAVLMSTGNSVGLATLAGFLAAVLFKLLE